MEKARGDQSLASSRGGAPHEGGLTGFLDLVAKGLPGRGAAKAAPAASPSAPSRAAPPKGAPAPLTLKISIPTMERATAAGAGARPKAALPRNQAEERLKRQLQEQRRVEQLQREAPAADADEADEASKSGADRHGDASSESASERSRRSDTSGRPKAKKRHKGDEGGKHSRKEEKRKRDEWRKKWKEDKKRRDAELALSAKPPVKKGKKSKRKARSDDSSASSQSSKKKSRSGSAGREPSPVLKRSQVQAQLVPQDRSVLSFGGQISDDELDKRLKLAQQISTGGSSQTLMTEAEVLALMKGKRRR